MEGYATQLVDGDLVSTREYWRRRFCSREDAVTDPRKLSEIEAQPSVGFTSA